MLRRRGVACCFFGNWNLQPCENQLRSKIPFSRGGDFQASKQEQVETLKVLYLLFVRRGFRGRAPTAEVRRTSTGTMYAFARAPAEVDARMDSQTRNCHAPWPCRPSKPPLYVRKPQCVNNACACECMRMKRV